MEIPDIPLTNNPLTNAPDESRQKPVPADLRPLNVKKTVVVVDDDPMMLDVLARILQRENFELVMGGGGPEIINKLSAHDGRSICWSPITLCRTCRAASWPKRSRRFPAVKVLYQTGFSDMLFENRVELEDGAAFLEKPSPHAAFAKLLDWCSSGQSTPSHSHPPFGPSPNSLRHPGVYTGRVKGLRFVVGFLVVATVISVVAMLLLYVVVTQEPGVHQALRSC